MHFASFALFVCCSSYCRISLVDDLSHEVSEEEGLGDDGEPGEQMAGAQAQQLWRHLQHGEPQQPHRGLNLSRGRFSKLAEKRNKLPAEKILQRVFVRSVLSAYQYIRGSSRCINSIRAHSPLTSPSSLSVSPLDELVFPLRCLFLCLFLLLCLASTSYRSFMLRDGLMRKAALARR